MTLRNEHADLHVQDDVLEDGNESDEVNECQVETKATHFRGEFQKSVSSLQEGWSLEKLVADIAKTTAKTTDAEGEASESEVLAQQSVRHKKKKLFQQVSDEGATPRVAAKKQSLVRPMRNAARSTSKSRSRSPPPRRQDFSQAVRSKPSSKLTSGSQLAKNTLVEPKVDSISLKADDKGSKIGRKEITAQTYLETHWPLWEDSDEHTSFFSNRSDLAARVIRRFIDKSTVAVLQEKDEGKKAAKEIIKKKLQIMSDTVKLHNAWAQKKSLTAGVANFDSGWKALITFASADPEVQFFCKHLTLLRLKIITCQTDEEPMNSLALEFRQSSLITAGLSIAEDDVQPFQKKHINLAVMNMLEFDGSTDKAIAVMRATFSSFVAERVEEYNQELLDDIRSFHLTLGPFCKANALEMMAPLKEALDKIPSEKMQVPSDQQSCLSLLRMCPQHGETIIKTAHGFLAQAQELQEFKNQITIKLEQLTEIPSASATTFEGRLTACKAWEGIEIWIRGLTDAQDLDFSELFKEDHDKFLKYADIALLWMYKFIVSTWAEDFMFLAKEDFVIEKDFQAHKAAMLDLLSTVSFSEPSIVRKDTYFNVLNSVQTWYSNSDLLVQFRQHPDNAHFSFENMTTLHDLRSVFDEVQSVSLTFSDEALKTSVEKIQQEVWLAPYMFPRLVSYLASVEDEPSQRLDENFRKCLALEPLFTAVDLTKEDVDKIQACVGDMVFVDDVKLVKRIAESRRNIPLLRKIGLHEKIIISTVAAAKVDIMMMDPDTNDELIAQAKEAKTLQIDALEKALDDNITEELAKETRSGFNISKATENRVARRITLSLEEAVLI